MSFCTLMDDDMKDFISFAKQLESIGVSVSGKVVTNVKEKLLK